MSKSPCAHLQRQPDFSLSGVLSARITNRPRDTQVILTGFCWNCFFMSYINRALTKKSHCHGKMKELDSKFNCHKDYFIWTTMLVWTENKVPLNCFLKMQFNKISIKTPILYLTIPRYHGLDLSCLLKYHGMGCFDVCLLPFEKWLAPEGSNVTHQMCQSFMDSCMMTLWTWKWKVKLKKNEKLWGGRISLISGTFTGLSASWPLWCKQLLCHMFPPSHVPSVMTCCLTIGS